MSIPTRNTLTDTASVRGSTMAATPVTATQSRNIEPKMVESSASRFRTVNLPFRNAVRRGNFYRKAVCAVQRQQPAF